MSDVAEVKEAIERLEQFHDGTRDGCMACCRSEFCPEAVAMRAARRWVRMAEEFPSDEDVEVAAAALWREKYPHTLNEWGHVRTVVGERWRHKARAALEAVAAVGVEGDTSRKRHTSQNREVCGACAGSGVVSCRAFPCEHGGHTCGECDGSGWAAVGVEKETL